MMRYEKELFGDMQNRVLWSDIPPNDVKENMIITLTNINCEFSYDNIKGSFENDLLYAYVCDLEFLSADLSNYDVTKSNNGGKYAFANCKIVKIKEVKY